MTPKRGEPWHLDKRVPIALIATILIQTAGIVWWASGITGTVGDHDRRLARLEANDVEMARAFSTAVERLARLEERTTATYDLVRRIDQRLDSRGQ
jgi:hypothetical protein